VGSGPRNRTLRGVSTDGLAVFDIDGVVADVRHRLHHLAGRAKDWDGFFDAAADDPPLSVGVELALELSERHEIVWLTGRPAWLRRVTRHWLQAHGLDDTELHMRPNHDYRPARQYKLSVLRELAPRQIAAFIDDDDEVISAALAAGYPAILADWVPRAAAMREAQDKLGRS
jgi:phosphoglycolate phosphatase-like HAD superfamily hydrolase